jgi:hypothetical protein
VRARSPQARCWRPFALTGFGILEVGIAGAEDPEYTVVPQRERLAARQNDHASTITH